jgi:DNA-binding MarR family transcriptional regulator
MVLYSCGVHQDEAIADGLQRLSRWAIRVIPKQMSMTALSTLSTLAAGPLRVSDLAEREGATQPGMTALVNRLAAAGYVQRTPDPHDGRATLVQLTLPGEHVLDERRSARISALRAEIETLPPEHRRALADALPAIEFLTAGLDKPHD